MYDPYLYKVTEENVDGCGGSADIFLGALEKLTVNEQIELSSILAETKRKFCNEDFSTEDFVVEAVNAYNEKHEDNPLFLTSSPYSAEITF